MKLISLFYAILAGIILTFSFAPFSWGILATIAPALLLCLWQHKSPKQAFGLGWFFGMGFFGSGVYWLYISMYEYGQIPAIFAGLLTILFIAALALFPALNGLIFKKFFPKESTLTNFCIFPVIWVSLEWLRSWFLTGFPWLLLGYSQIATPLKGYAPIFGILGVSLVTVICSVAVYHILVKRNTAFNSLMLILLIGLGSGLEMIHWTKPIGKPLTVSLVQGNVPQTLKWSPDSVEMSLERYATLSEPHWKSDIVIWPESALPLSMQDAQPFLAEMDTLAKQHNSHFFTGVPIHVPTGGYYNAIIGLGLGKGTYLKQHLVPFGEYIPFQKTFGKLFDLLGVPMSDFVAGTPTIEPLDVSGIKIAGFICYEITYPTLFIRSQPDFNLLLTITNDAWFDRSIAQAQHLEMAQMRSLAMQKPGLFVSNNGITAIIHSNGSLAATIPPYESGVLTGTIQPMQGKTPYQQFPSLPTLCVLLFLLGLKVTNIVRHIFFENK